MSQTPVQIALEELLDKALALRASRLLLLPGQKPVCRVGRELQPALSDHLVTPEATRSITAPLLTDAMLATLETNGTVERPFLIGRASGEVTIFLGQGNHHLVFHLEPPA